MRIMIKPYNKYSLASFVFLFSIFSINLQGMLSKRADIQAIRQRAQQQPRKTITIPSRLKEHLTKTQPTHIQNTIKDSLKNIATGLKIDEFFVYKEGSTHGTKVTKEVLLLSQTAQNMIGDESFQSDIPRLIPFPFSSDTIASTFDILDHLYKMKISKESDINEDQIIQAHIKSKSTEELIKITEFINYLDCSTIDLEKVYFSAVKNSLNSGQEKVIQALSAIQRWSFWKQLLINPTIVNYLKGLMMKYNMNHVKPKYLEWRKDEDKMIKSITFPNEKSILVGMSHDSNTLISRVFFTLLNKLHSNIGSSNKTDFFIYAGTSCGKIIEEKGKNGYPIFYLYPGLYFLNKPIQKTIFNPTNNAQLLVGLYNNTADNLLLYNKDLDIMRFNLTRAFTGHEKEIQDIAFNGKGSQIVSADKGNTNNLKLWNIDNSTAINSWSIPGINSIAFSSDGTKIIALSSSKRDNFFSSGGFYRYCNATLCIIDLSTELKIPQCFALVANNQYKSDLSFVLTKDDQMLAWDFLGNIFFITFDDNIVTNEMQIRQSTTNDLIRNGIITSLNMGPNDKTIITGRKQHYQLKNFLQLNTDLTDFDNEVLKLFTNISDSDLEKNIGTYSLMYQFWLNSRKGIDLKSYQMNATEQKIYNSLPEQIKRLF